MQIITGIKFIFLLLLIWILSRDNLWGYSVNPYFLFSFILLQKSSDNIRYYFDNIPKLRENGYILDDEDIIMHTIETNKIIVTKFSSKGKLYF